MHTKKYGLSTNVNSTEHIATALDARKSGSGWMARCPAHDDKTPSLSITDSDGRTLVHCHAGCPQDDVINALRDRGLWPTGNKSPRRGPSESEIDHALTVKMLADSDREKGEVLSPEDEATLVDADTTLRQADGSQSPVILTRVADVQREKISWLHEPRIALGKVSFIAGDPGLGKSLVTLHIAAHVSRGTPWPVDKTPCPLGDVILLSAEDAIADTIRPRLEAAGADLSRVYVIEAIRETKGGENFERTFSIRRDVKHVKDVLNNLPDCRLIIIDPISAYLGSTDSHNNADVRQVLAPLAKLAEKAKLAIVCVSHLNKSSGSNAIYRITGSLAFAAAARVVYIVAKDPAEPRRRLFVPAKNNLGDDTTGLAFSIIEHGNGAPYLSWENKPVPLVADDVLNQEHQTERDVAQQWLRLALSDGPLSATDLEAAAEEAGHAWRTIKRAKDDLGIESKKTSFEGGWRWHLPKEATEAEEGHPTEVDSLGEFGPLGSDGQDHSRVDG